MMPWEKTSAYSGGCQELARQGAWHGRRGEPGSTGGVKPTGQGDLSDMASEGNPVRGGPGV